MQVPSGRRALFPRPAYDGPAGRQPLPRACYRSALYQTPHVGAAGPIDVRPSG